MEAGSFLIKFDKMESPKGNCGQKKMSRLEREGVRKKRTAKKGKKRRGKATVTTK